MLFNSVQFGLFFIVVYSLYLLSRHKLQNRILLVASYIFYGAWDWRFLSLIVVSTILDYFCGIYIDKSESARKRKILLFMSVAANLSILGFFKYFGFFAQSLQDLLGYFDISVQAHFVNIILPVGISFYTFQTMSYTIDIYRREMKPTRRFLDFALFVSFFPQLVAGPIERAKRLLPQILAPRHVTLDKFYEGCFLIFWGLFQKVFVADNLATIVDSTFNASAPESGALVLLSLYAFAFQIFCDFAGYSNIARGLGRVMGFDIMVNFNLPYFAPNPREFWRRWHISLSTWLRDYLYIPLGGSKGGPFATYKNLTLTMLLGGLWHGAAWTFVMWGAYQGFLLMIHRMAEPLLIKLFTFKSALIAGIWSLVKVVLFFQFVCLGWLLFRAQSVDQVAYMLKSIFTDFRPDNKPLIIAASCELVFATAVLIVVQCFQYFRKDLLVVYKSPVIVKSAFYALCLILLLVFSGTHAKEFIYFQF